MGIDAEKNHYRLQEPVVDLTPKNFEAETQQNVIHNSSIVVGFFNRGCRYCKRTVPVFEQMAQRLRETQRFGSVDDSIFYQLGEPYKVQSWPSFVYLERSTSGSGVKVTKYFGPRTADDVQVWMCLKLGIAMADLALWKRLVFGALHLSIAAIVLLLESMGVEPSDHGSAGGPLPDGGTIGLAALIIGVSVASILLTIFVARCCYRRRSLRLQAHESTTGAQKKNS